LALAATTYINKRLSISYRLWSTKNKFKNLAMNLLTK